MHFLTNKTVFDYLPDKRLSRSLIGISGYTKSMLNSRNIFAIGNSSRLFSIYKKSPLITSCNDSNKVELLSAIDSIYNEEWRVRGVLPSRKENLQKELLVKDNILFGPIDYYQFQKSEINDLFYSMLDMESRNGYLWKNEWVDDDVNMIGVYTCRNPTDLFLMKALERVILREICYSYLAPITTNVSTLNDLKYKHYDFLNRQLNVVQLIMIDLTPCMERLMNSRILKCFVTSKCKGVVFNLVKQIIYRSIYDMKSQKWISTNKRIPPIGEITNVILHHFYQNVFDKVFEEKFPEITYSRWGHEVVIAIKKNESFTFDNDTITSLLEEIDLDADFSSIFSKYGGNLPACHGEKAILLLEDGCVSVWRYEDL